MENRATQLNPNNQQFHRSRGLDSRPGSWNEQIEKNKIEGLLENRANTSASKINHKAIGRDVVRIEKVVKSVLGEHVKIYKGGSVKKHTNIEGSDLDLKIDVVDPVTETQRNSLTLALQNEYGITNVEVKPKVHLIRGESGSIDLFPQKANYLCQDAKVDKLGKDPFRTNPIGRNAVRILKMDILPNAPFPSIEIERAVLQAQNMERGIGLLDLVVKARNIVFLNCC